MQNIVDKWREKESWQAASYAVLLLILALILLGRALFPPGDRVLGEGYDMPGAYYLWHKAAHEAVRAGRLPTWDPYLFNGYPFLVNPQVDFFYPPAWLTIILPVPTGISWYAVFHIWMAGLGMLLFVRAVSHSWSGGLLAGLAFSFSAFMTARIWAGHLVPLATHVWLPWMLLGLLWSVRRRDIWPAVLSAVPFALAVLAGHTTSLLYVGLVWSLFVLYLGLTGKQSRLVLRQAAIMAVLGLALSAVQSAALAQFSLLSTRIAEPSYQFATDYSFPPAHLITLLIPDYFGEPVRAGYWSVPTFVELTAYTGILPLLGLVLALRQPTRLVWFYLIVIIIGLLLALGHYGFLYRVFYDLLPPFRLARAPGRAMFLYVFAVSALLGEAVALWQRTPAEEARLRLGHWWRWALAIATVSGLAALAATGAAFAAQHPSETSGRLWSQLGGWSLALLLFLVAGGLLWVYVTTTPERTGRRTLLMGSLAFLGIADLWFFGFKMVQLAPTTPEKLWLDARQIIGETEQRILPWGVSLFWQNGPGEVGLRSVFGYNSLESEAYQRFIDSVPDPRATTYDIWGAAYTVSPGPLDNFTEGEQPLTLVDRTDSVWVYRRGRVVPIARLAYQVEVIADPARAIDRIHAPDFDPMTTVILPESPPCQVGPIPTEPGTAEILAHESDSWRIRTSSDEPALLVLSETAYPGWRVTIDGRPAESLTAYTTIRAACVPAGEHTVAWTFAPTIYQVGGVITLFSLALVAVAAVSLRRAR